MYKKILIANRGEIALRIIRSCREMGIKTVSVYSKADELSLHTKFADEAICIGPNHSKNSYLNIPSIISAAELTNADAIHPGYGFLSESSDFAEICIQNNIEFIGSKPEVLSSMGNKSKAKKTMQKNGIPVIPGYIGLIKDLEMAKTVSEDIGYPVILKASSGGGGKGMRIINNAKDLEVSFSAAQSEALASFNDDSIYIEKYISKPRHIEVQILGDKEGNIVALGERDCTIQRRYQKLIEEAPSPVVSDKIREKLSKTAINAAKSVNYVGAGTVEFLLDSNGDYYFMEMNTRIQVEHPVTEMVLGIDLIKYQILCHVGLPLPSWMKNFKMRGHSIECRINAEDPLNNFRPSPGTITSFHKPGGMGIRADTHVYAGYTVPPYYDSMIVKLVVHASNRSEAINKMLGALSELVVEGIKTTIPFQIKILSDSNFKSGKFSTNFLENFKYEYSK